VYEISKFIALISKFLLLWFYDHIPQHSVPIGCNTLWHSP